MQSLTSDETYAAKRAFERFAKQHGIDIQHYHADNGRFADNMFINACQQQRQQLTFCGVNAHFQNGIAERAIRDLTESARKQLLHAKQRWPAAVHLAYGHMLLGVPATYTIICLCLKMEPHAWKSSLAFASEPE
jgi:hypothetical protein